MRLEMPFRVKQFQVNENPLHPEEYDCCPHCGSLGVIHFEDKDDGDELLHRCLRCNGEFFGCTSSTSGTPAERLSNVGKLST